MNQVTRAQYRDILDRLARAEQARAAACRNGTPAEKRAAGKIRKSIEAELAAARSVGVKDR